MRLTTLISIAILLSQSLYAQLNWDARASLPNLGRHDGVSFVLNGKIYAGLGRIYNGDHVNDFWEYDPATDIWTKKASYPGDGPFAPFYFEVNNRGYVVGGYGDNGVTNETWEYNPNTNAWTQRANYAGGVRYSGAAFVIGDTAYVGAGSSSTSTSGYTNTFYRYIPSTNSWSAISSFPGGNTINHSCFSINGFGFVGNTTNTAINPSNSFYKYDPSSDSWSSISSMPGNNRRLAIAVAIDTQALVGCGTTSGSPITTYVNDFYMYSASTDSWTQLTSNSNFTGRYAPILCNIGDTAIYVGLGKTSQASLTDFWQLQLDTNFCEFFDTTYVTINDTIIHHDTTFINDTTFIDVYDTTYVTVYDTTFIQVYDTTNIIVYDTTYINVFDTTYINIYDTSYVTIYDTSYVTVFDTTMITVYDTSTIVQYVTVEDTLNITLYDDDPDCWSLDLQVYPNPSSEFLNIFTVKDECLRYSKLELIDQLGRVLDSKTVTEQITTFDLRGYASALYYLRITNKFGVEWGTVKILIQ